MDSSTAPRDLDEWQQRWTEDQTGWNESEGNGLLWRNLKPLLAKRFPDRKPVDLKVFVPLCGKAKDMYLFYQMGFTVVGVEYASKAIKDFFEENEMPNVDTTNSPFSANSDKRIVLGQGDLYAFKSHPNASDQHKLPFPKYDIIWDRGSFEAIDKEMREKYACHMSELLAKDGLYLMSVDNYDPSEYTGPPFDVKTEDLQLWFGAEMSIEEVDKEDRLGPNSDTREYWLSQGLTWMTEHLYELRWKQ